MNEYLLDNVNERINKQQRQQQNGHKSGVVWFTGLSGSGKSTVSHALEQRLQQSGVHTYLLDGDRVRKGLNSDLGFSPSARKENIRRVAEVAKLFVDAGILVIVASISPFREDREQARALFKQDEFWEVYVDCPIEECVRRDPKGLYEKASSGQIQEFTGLTSPYEVPLTPDIHLHTDQETIAFSVNKVYQVVNPALSTSSEATTSAASETDGSPALPSTTKTAGVGQQSPACAADDWLAHIPVPPSFLDLFLQSDAFELITHVHGDADSASVFALAAGLQKMGKKVNVSHDLPEQLQWLTLPLKCQPLLDDRKIVAVDTANFARLAFPAAVRQELAILIAQYDREDNIPEQQLLGLQRVDAAIDHHVSHRGYANQNWIDPIASSTAEMLTALLVNLERASGQSLFDEEVVLRLYAGLVSDTNWFKRNSATARTYAIANFLERKAAIDKACLADRLDTFSENYFRLGETLRRTFRNERGVASAYLDLASMNDCSVTPDEAAAMIGEMERLPVRACLLFVEMPGKEVRVRLRSKEVPVIELAQRFGGGGHTYRAGVILADASTVPELLRVAVEYLGYPE